MWKRNATYQLQRFDSVRCACGTQSILLHGRKSGMKLTLRHFWLVSKFLSVVLGISISKDSISTKNKYSTLPYRGSQINISIHFYAMTLLNLTIIIVYIFHKHKWTKIWLVQSYLLPLLVPSGKSFHHDELYAHLKSLPGLRREWNL